MYRPVHEFPNYAEKVHGTFEESHNSCMFVSRGNKWPTPGIVSARMLASAEFIDDPALFAKCALGNVFIK